MRGPTGSKAFDKAIALAGKGTGLDLDQSRAKFCFGMSKMTVKDENTNASLKYNVLEPCEFYEYIGRLAHEKFKDQPSKPLDQKINHVMDLIFPKFKLTRKQVGFKEIQDGASSDDSVEL